MIIVRPCSADPRRARLHRTLRGEVVTRGHRVIAGALDQRLNLFHRRRRRVAIAERRANQHAGILPRERIPHDARVCVGVPSS